MTEQLNAQQREIERGLELGIVRGSGLDGAKGLGLDNKRRSGLDSGIDIPSSMEIPSISISMPSSPPIASSPPIWSQSSPISEEQPFNPDPISPCERREFHLQQNQRHEQRFQVQKQVQHAGHDVWDVEHRLDQWVGKCPLCYIRKYHGQAVEFGHSLEGCCDEEKDIIWKEVQVLHDMPLEEYAGCNQCGVPQQICMQWEGIHEGDQKFKQVPEGVCQYHGIIPAVVATIMMTGPLEVVKQEVWSRMQQQGIWGANEWLDPSEEEVVTQEMLKWFTQKAIWGGIEASILFQMFYYLTIGLEKWSRNNRK